MDILSTSTRATTGARRTTSRTEERAPLAQLVEQEILNLRVTGSSPVGRTAHPEGFPGYVPDVIGLRFGSGSKAEWGVAQRIERRTTDAEVRRFESCHPSETP